MMTPWPRAIMSWQQRAVEPHGRHEVQVQLAVHSASPSAAKPPAGDDEPPSMCTTMSKPPRTVPDGGGKGGAAFARGEVSRDEVNALFQRVPLRACAGHDGRAELAEQPDSCRPGPARARGDERAFA